MAKRSAKPAQSVRKPAAKASATVSKKAGKSKAKKVQPKKKAAISRKPSRKKQAEERFVKDLLVRGEAAPLTEGVLPQQATHVIVNEDEEGRPVVKRVRFKLF